ncbi:MAG: hypothetical protein Kow00121_37810 [Elainellaceae cyanobacterium]
MAADIPTTNVPPSLSDSDVEALVVVSEVDEALFGSETQPKERGNRAANTSNLKNH